MKRYRIEKTCAVDNAKGQPVKRKAGDVVAESDILPGCLAEMLRLGMATEHVEPVPEPEKPAPIKTEKPVKLKAGPADEPEAGPDYGEWTVEDLHHEASKREIEGRGSMDKAALVKAMEKDDKEQAKPAKSIEKPKK